MAIKKYLLFFIKLSMQTKDLQSSLDSTINSEPTVIQKYRALYNLKSNITQQSISSFLDSYNSFGDSELLKHELVYLLDQLNEDFYPLIKEFLFKCVKNKNQVNLVRYEAAFAISNYFDQDAVQLLEQHLNCGVQFIQQSCLLALKKIKNKQSQLYGRLFFGTRQPAPPFTKQQFEDLLKQKNLQSTYKKHGYIGVLQQSLYLVTKYRIIYYMRNIGDQNIKLQLCKMLSKKHARKHLALFKQQICFILGQIGIEEGEQLNYVKQCIENQKEDNVVKFQALAALGSQSTDTYYLQKFLTHQNQLIKECAEVSLQLIRTFCQQNSEIEDSAEDF